MGILQFVPVWQDRFSMQCQTTSGYCFRQTWAADRILLRSQHRSACEQPGLFEDDFDRPDQLRTARVVVGDAKGPQQIEQDIF